MLYIVSTPIGNLEDITYRAVRIIKECDIILSEDTRRTLNLLRHLGIKKDVTSYNDHTTKNKEDMIIRLLKEGKVIALVSDCGTPMISDPGFPLVRRCLKEGILVSPIPGASALLSALVASGITTDRFIFFGFFPKKDKEIKKAIDMIKTINISSVFYESPHRISRTLKRLDETIPERRICIGREITKRFEEFIRGRASEVLDAIGTKAVKGEIVLIIEKEI